MKATATGSLVWPLLSIWLTSAAFGGGDDPTPLETSEMTSGQQLADANEDASVIAAERRRIADRLNDPSGRSGSDLSEAAPLIAHERVGAIHGYGLEQVDPFVSLSVYIFGDQAQQRDGIATILSELDKPDTLPPGGAKGTVGTGSVFVLGYYYADGSRGDAAAAKASMYALLGRIGGVE